jgi:hypothetical protein
MQKNILKGNAIIYLPLILQNIILLLDFMPPKMPFRGLRFASIFFLFNLAKVGDALQRKIPLRPSREELHAQNILKCERGCGCF